MKKSELPVNTIPTYLADEYPETGWEPVSKADLEAMLKPREDRLDREYKYQDIKVLETLRSEISDLKYEIQGADEVQVFATESGGRLFTGRCPKYRYGSVEQRLNSLADLVEELSSRLSSDEGE